VAAAFISKASRDIPVALRCSLAAGAALVVAPLNIVSLMIPNAAVLYFPSWFYAGKNAPQGIEATGQRMIFALGQFLVFAIALAPASLAFLAVFFVARLALPVEFVIPLAALAAAAVLAAEGAAGVAWLGRLFEKLDISSESSPD